MIECVCVWVCAYVLPVCGSMYLLTAPRCLLLDKVMTASAISRSIAWHTNAEECKSPDAGSLQLAKDDTHIEQDPTLELNKWCESITYAFGINSCRISTQAQAGLRHACAHLHG